MTNRERCLKKNAEVSPKLLGNVISRSITEDKPQGYEVAILRKTLHAVIHGEPIPEEFESYYAEAETVKAEIKGASK